MKKKGDRSLIILYKYEFLYNIYRKIALSLWS